jgi:hypothetical protein
MTPIDRISLELPALRRLGAVVRATVSWEAKRCGLAGSRAQPLAQDVARRFQALAASMRARGGPGAVEITLDTLPGELKISLRRRGARSGSVVRARLPRAAKTPRRPAPRHPSV